MPSAPEYPRIIKHGSVVVKVYRAKQKTTATGWAYVLAWVPAVAVGSNSSPMKPRRWKKYHCEEFGIA